MKINLEYLIAKGFKLCWNAFENSTTVNYCNHLLFEKTVNSDG